MTLKDFGCIILGMILPAICFFACLLIKYVWLIVSDFWVWRHMILGQWLTEKDFEYSRQIRPDAHFHRWRRLVAVWNGKKKFYEFAIVKKERSNENS